MSASGPKDQLGRYSLRPKRHFGQNFLADARLCRRMAELAADPPGGTVVEIGAGLGALTRPLLDRARRVIAVERDRDLIEPLRKELAPSVASGALTVLEQDAKTLDLALTFEGTPEPRALAGNLPYQLTGPLLRKTTDAAAHVERVVYLVQLEVADRLVATPGTPSYGALSVFLQARFDVRRAFVVRRGAFVPQPRVDSAVVVLTPVSPLPEETPAFRELVTAAFAQRRKTLRNAWRGVLGLSTDAVASAAERAGIRLDARGETLDVAAYQRMSREVAA